MQSTGRLRYQIVKGSQQMLSESRRGMLNASVSRRKHVEANGGEGQGRRVSLSHGGRGERCAGPSTSLYSCRHPKRLGQLNGLSDHSLLLLACSTHAPSGSKPRHETRA